MCPLQAKQVWRRRGMPTNKIENWIFGEIKVQIKQYLKDFDSFVTNICCYFHSKIRYHTLLQKLTLPFLCPCSKLCGQPKGLHTWDNGTGPKQTWGTSLFPGNKAGWVLPVEIRKWVVCSCLVNCLLCGIVSWCLAGCALKLFAPQGPMLALLSPEPFSSSLLALNLWLRPSRWKNVDGDGGEGEAGHVVLFPDKYLATSLDGSKVQG